MIILNTLHKSGWILTISIILILTVSNLIQHGMFMDAMLYTSVSHNLSQGIGSFWFPYFDEYNLVGLSSFHEQPPLVFGIQSLFFSVLGDSMFVERFYVLVCLIITALLIRFQWKKVFQNNENLQSFSWLPVLLWITIPVCFWSFSNNMHENTMGIFIFLAAMLSIFNLEKDKPQFLNWLLVSVCIALAFLSKGFPSFFPLGVPFIYWLVFRKHTFMQTMIQSFTIVLGLVIIGFALYFYQPSHDSLSIYLFKRAFQRINDVPSVDSRFFIIGRMFSEMIPNIALFVLLYSIAKWKNISTEINDSKKWGLFFIAVGISGSLPLMLTKVQNGFYAVPSLPFFGLGFACLIVPILFQLCAKINLQSSKRILITTVLLLICSLTFVISRYGHYTREKDLLNDVNQIGGNILAQSYIQTDNYNIYSNWSLGTYLMRYYNIGLREGDASFYIIEKNKMPSKNQHWEKMKLNTVMYDIYQKN